METQELHRGRLIDHIQLVVQDLPASRVFYEAVLGALVLARAILRKFGGDSLEETKRNYEAYLEQVRQRLTWDKS